MLSHYLAEAMQMHCFPIQLWGLKRIFFFGGDRTAQGTREEKWFEFCSERRRGGDLSPGHTIHFGVPGFLLNCYQLLLTLKGD